MARATFEDFIPVESGDQAITALVQNSVVERIARKEPMSSDTKQVPRSGRFDIAPVAKGAPYAETVVTSDYVELIARKAGGVVRIAEEDLLDSSMDILSMKRADAARSMAIFLDNACLGVTAASNGTTIPFTSAYRALTQADGTVGYSANANLIQTAGALTYDDFNELLARLENSIWADPSSTVIIANPAFKSLIRGLKDTTGVPLFVETQNDTSDRFFGHPINWSMGARTSATATHAPAGNPLMFAVNTDMLILGMAKLSPTIATPNPGFALQRANVGVGYLTDEALLKASMRRGFVVGAAAGIAAIEITAA